MRTSKNIVVFSLFSAINLLGLQAEAILRNLITDRCIHIGHEDTGNSSEVSVFTKECSWNNKDRGQKGDKDQWVELNTFPHGSKNIVTIHKLDAESPICITTRGNSIITGNCLSPNAHFAIKININGEQFSTLEQPPGKCLTVQPGTQYLSMKNCTNDNVFQQWTICRHINKCDVEANWSAASITYPKEANDIQNESLNLNKSINELKVKPKSKLHSNDIIIINEILYYAQNSLKIMNSSSQIQELANIISQFYSEVEIQEATRVLMRTCGRNHSTGDPSIDTLKSNSESANKSHDLEYINGSFVTSLNTLYSLDATCHAVFVSQDMSRIPTTHTTDSSSNKDNCLDKLKKNIDEKVDTLMQSLDMLKTSLGIQEQQEMSKNILIELNIDSLASAFEIVTVTPNSSENSSANPDIDVRLNVPSRNLSKQPYNSSNKSSTAPANDRTNKKTKVFISLHERKCRIQSP